MKNALKLLQLAAKQWPRGECHHALTLSNDRLTLTLYIDEKWRDVHFDSVEDLTASPEVIIDAIVALLAEERK